MLGIALAVNRCVEGSIPSLATPKTNTIQRRYEMAVKEVLVDDIDGETEGASTLSFTVDGQEFEVDLAEENMEHYQAIINEFNATMKELAEYGRPVVRRMGQTAKPKPKYTPAQLAEIRNWLRSNGHQVSDFGRIREELLTKWENRPENLAPMIAAGGSEEVNGDAEGQ
jgi:hypothetical protein